MSDQEERDRLLGQLEAMAGHRISGAAPDLSPGNPFAAAWARMCAEAYPPGDEGTDHPVFRWHAPDSPLRRLIDEGCGDMTAGELYRLWRDAQFGEPSEDG